MDQIVASIEGLISWPVSLLASAAVLTFIATTIFRSVVAEAAKHVAGRVLSRKMQHAKESELETFEAELKAYEIHLSDRERDLDETLAHFQTIHEENAKHKLEIRALKAEAEALKAENLRLTEQNGELIELSLKLQKGRSLLS